MALHFSWRLPHQAQAPTPALPDWQAQPGGWIQLAQAVEYAGLDGVWIDSGPGLPDSLGVAAALSAHTERIGVTVSIAAEVMLPAALAGTVQSLQSISGQRVRLHLCDRDRHVSGVTLNRDQRSERLEEYLELLSRLLSPDGDPVNHTGRYFQLENAGIVRRGGLAAPLLLNDHLGPATVGRYADQCLLGVGPLQPMAARIERHRAAAGVHQRPLSFACGLGLMLGDSDDEAWQCALDHLDALGIAPASDIAGVRDLPDPWAALKRLAIHPNLWQPTADAPVFLVGGAQRIAERLALLHELGIRHVVFESRRPVADVLRFGERVVPLLVDRGLYQENTPRG